MSLTITRVEEDPQIDELPLAPDDGWNAIYVDGKWTDAEDGNTIPVENPSTRSTIGEVAAATTTDVNAAYAAAAGAQAAWAERTPVERAAVVEEARHLIEEFAESLHLLYAVECGGVALKGGFENQIAADMMKVAEGLATQVGGTHKQSVTSGKENLVLREPSGTVGAITPWNFPFYLSMRIVAPALALGNAVVLKPAEETSIMGGLAIARLFEKADLPKGLLNVVPGTGSEAGDAVASHPDAGMVSFTGSTQVGRRVGSKAAGNLAYPSLELGGNNAHIVCEDADLDRAVDGGVFGSFTHQGQECISINRHIVHESLYDEYVERVAARAEQLPIGDPRSGEDVLVGPVINESQRDKMVSFLRETVEAGATIEAGGDYDGLYVEPTVLSGVTNDMPLACNEHFGPIAPVICFTDNDEAVAMANDSEYGLSGSVHSTDLACARDMAERIESGMVHINDQPLNDDPHTPFGGVKGSGVGRYNGEWIMRQLTEPKWISIQREPREYPY